LGPDTRRQVQGRRSPRGGRPCFGNFCCDVGPQLLRDLITGSADGRTKPCADVGGSPASHFVDGGRHNGRSDTGTPGVGSSYDRVVAGVRSNEHNGDAISHHDSQRLWWTRECCGRLRAGRSSGGGNHRIGSGSGTVSCNELNVVPVDLLHILELPCTRTTGAQANSLFQPGATGHHVRGVVPHMESQVPGACIREGYRNAGPYFIPPPKHLVLTL